MAVVLEHVLDEAAGVYRLAYGTPVTETVHAAPDPDDPDAPLPDPVEVVIGHTDIHDVVWAADDERWFDGDERRPLEDVAAEQRGLLKSALDARAVAAEHAEDEAAAVEELPGVGEVL